MYDASPVAEQRRIRRRQKSRRFPMDKTERPGSLWAVALLSLPAGAAVGLLTALFRLALERADDFRNLLIARAHAAPVPGFLLVVAVGAAAVAAAAWLVHRLSPYAAGSGIPQVEAALAGGLPPAPPHLIAVKFVGGVLAIGAGLALGREGPSVQMGAVIANQLGKACRCSAADGCVLLAAGAGAGLAVAFNAPIAGAVFVLEELVRRFDLRIAIAALGSSATAILVARLLLGNAPDFAVAISAAAGAATGPLPYAVAAVWPLYFATGITAGLAAALYNRAVLGAVTLADRLGRTPVELQAAFIGAAVAILAWFLPDLVGGGDPVTQRLLAGGASLPLIPLAFLLRFGLGAVSYAARTPGGLFAPMLALGTQLGLVAGLVARAAFPHLAIEPEAFAVVGMAAFFAGVVQAPVTGIVLVTEMTAAFTTLLPMLAAAFAAMLTANLMRSPPIYDSLRRRVVTAQRSAAIEADGGEP
jgi:chloride channel protein, CIC family